MKKIELTKTQVRNLFACNDDLALIEMEILRAEKAGVPIDPNLLPQVEECKRMLHSLHSNYVQKSEREVV